jgi:hypothetical protein
VLHRAIGGTKAMRSQLYRLAEVAEHPRTTIQVIRSDGAHAGLLGAFIIADLDSKPSVVYLETSAEGIVTNSSSAVNHVAMRLHRGRRHRPGRSRPRQQGPGRPQAGLSRRHLERLHQENEGCYSGVAT